jgi:hypothetical protein
MAHLLARMEDRLRRTVEDVADPMAGRPWEWCPRRRIDGSRRAVLLAGVGEPSFCAGILRCLADDDR